MKILSGIQPTGIPHLGNYLGAISSWVKLQKHPQAIFSIVDLHAITVPQAPDDLRRNTNQLSLSLLACGIQPQNLFRQSQISEHSELAWILFCRTPVSWLQRMHQWKDKGELANSSLGLLSYPVLQAADILLYNTTHVPVGQDQVQHINLVSDIAKSFNSSYNEKIFTVPEGSQLGHRIMSLKTPLSKMSKSDISDLSRISLTDSDQDIMKKIRKSTMDSIQGIQYTKERPGVLNLLNILMSIQDLRRDSGKWDSLPEEERDQLVSDQFGEMGNAQFKEVVASEIIDMIRPIRTKYEILSADPLALAQAYEMGETRVSHIAAETLKRVKHSIGL